MHRHVPSWMTALFSRRTSEQAGHCEVCPGHVKILVQTGHIKGSRWVPFPFCFTLKLCQLTVSMSPPYSAISVLKDKEPGSFIVRDSHSFKGAYGLAMKVATPPPSVFQQCKKGMLHMQFGSIKAQLFAIFF